MVICVFVGFKMRYNNINLFISVFITSINQHFYLHSNTKLIILQPGFLHSFAAAFH